VREPSPAKGAGGGLRRIGDVRKWLGISGAALGTDGVAARTFLYSFAAAAAIIGAVNVVNVITIQHEEPAYGLAGPIIWEGSSWLTSLLFFWISWLGYRVAPPFARPRWKLLIHILGALAYSLGHVGGFVLLRKLAYWAAGAQYEFGAFLPHFRYELGKDVFDYALNISMFTLFEHLLRQRRPLPSSPATFDIRDGAKITRAAVADILAVASAGNYVEFVLRDGRKLLMRSPLSAIEAELAPRGFVRVHRSWLVNAMQMTTLTPDGSGDYTVELGTLVVPLSRRFPEALARLKSS
jgi:hypothetical protein